MGSFSIKDLAKIIERDSKDATYKFAFAFRTEFEKVIGLYIGSAIGQGGVIYTYNKDSSRNPRIGHLTLEWIINHSGTFTIPIDIYHVMQTVGRFVTGSHSIIFRWAEFTSHLSKETAISTSDMISLLKSDFNERDILYREFTSQFRTEMQVSLLGRKPFSDRSWKNDSYENLTHLCEHLIEDRGFEPYKNI